MGFRRTIQNIKRLREIVGVLLKYGFEDFITQTQLRRFVPRKRRVTWQRRGQLVFELSRWERIRMAAEELGPTFVKLCQVLSNRPDILPEDLIEEFQKLQSKVEPFDVKVAREIIERELESPIDEIFEFFDDNVLGSASIGQVHRAKLKTGEDVVVKVQRPGVRRQIESDLNILKDLVRIGDNYLQKQGVLNAMDIVESFEKTMQKELDYLTEARAMDQFRNFYSNNKKFYVPKPFKEQSTSKTLIIEFIKGCKITDVDQLTEWGLDPTQIAEVGLDIYLTQIFEFGYFHADPHPGNVLVQESGRIVLIDFGMVGKMLKQDKYAFAGIFIAMANHDPAQMAINMRRLAVEHEIKDMRRLEADLNEIIEDFAYLDVEESSIADITTRLQDIIYKNKMIVPGSVFLIFRSLAILEGIGKTIHPTFNTMERVKPFGRRLIQEQFSFKNIGREVFTQGQSLYSFLATFPNEMKTVLRKLRKGKLKIEIENTGMEEFLHKMETLGNRLSLSLIISASLIAGSIVLVADPDYGNDEDVPKISIILFLMAGSLGAWLLWLMWRGRK